MNNLKYFFHKKQNFVIPDIFNDYILNEDFCFYSAELIEDFYFQLCKLDTKINFEDFGAKKNEKIKIKKISEIAKKTSTKFKEGIIFQKIIDYFNVKNILELGTSLGIGTMFLSGVSSCISVTTIEACKDIIDFTEQNFKANGINNVKFINDKFDNVFDKNLLNKQKFDLFFIDGNHTFDASLKYLKYIEQNLVTNRFIIIFDDINWSKDMYNAWKYIVKTHKNCFMMNFFRTGFLFYNYKLPEGEFYVKQTDNQFIN